MTHNSTADYNSSIGPIMLRPDGSWLLIDGEIYTPHPSEPGAPNCDLCETAPVTRKHCWFLVCVSDDCLDRAVDAIP